MAAWDDGAVFLSQPVAEENAMCFTPTFLAASMIACRAETQMNRQQLSDNTCTHKKCSC